MYCLFFLLTWPLICPPIFLQVNNENVVKVGHRQVVNMIRQGGNHLILKVVTVTRNLDPDDTARKKGACSSRLPARGTGRTHCGIGGAFSLAEPPQKAQTWDEARIGHHEHDIAPRPHSCPSAGPIGRKR